MLPDIIMASQVSFVVSRAVVSMADVAVPRRAIISIAIDVMSPDSPEAITISDSLLSAVFTDQVIISSY